ncbi:YegP family protein [Actinomadura scrupuli]|uniref:YegP family protein n=1 Tax=Actinomadura scrupuli TaxID=559629 RepID=UPI003D959555
MAGKFVLKQDRAGEFRFNLVASNGQVIASSESYKTKSAALNGIDSVKRHAPDASTDDQTE